MSQPAIPTQPHDYWQAMTDAAYLPPELASGVFDQRFPAALPDGRYLYLPLRQPPSRPGFAIASLIINQASFAVQDALADHLAAQLRPFAPEVIVGLPTLGLGLAAAVARRLGQARYVACGTSRKFWYDEHLSVALRSITSLQEKRLYLDPRLLPLLQTSRIALVDDVLSSGLSICAGLNLLGQIGMQPVAIGAAMLQTKRWSESLTQHDKSIAERVCGVLKTPLFAAAPGGWVVADETGTAL